MKRYLYLLEVFDDETKESLGHIEAYTQESLQEQLHKADSMIEHYESKKADPEVIDWKGVADDATWDDIDLNEHAERHHD